MKSISAVFLTRLAAASCLLSIYGGNVAVASAPIFTPTVVASYAHPEDAFTEGLVWENGKLYESTGKFGESRLSVRAGVNGKVLRARQLSAQLFGEGIALVGQEVMQLTWKNHRAYIYDKTSLRLKRSLPYPREGWGLTYDGHYLIASDGSATLYFLNPRSLRVMRRLVVQDDGAPISQLNELEYINGEIFANVFQSDKIARISAATGRVSSWLDLSALYPPALREDGDVLNGIAYNGENNHLLVTGKHWPKLYEITLP